MTIEGEPIPRDVKPCPFCSAPGLYDRTLGGKEWVSCSDHRCQASFIEMSLIEWNTRMWSDD